MAEIVASGAGPDPGTGAVTDHTREDCAQVGRIQHALGTLTNVPCGSTPR